MTQKTADRIATLVERGEASEARILAAQALRDAAGTERAELLLAVSALHAGSGEHVQALGASVEAGELFQEAGEPLRFCDALLRTAVTLRAAGDHATTLSTLEHAETLARQGGDELRTARTLRQIGVVSSVLGRHQHAQSCLEEACETLARVAGADEQRAARLSLLNVFSRRFDEQPDSAELVAQLESHLSDWRALAQDAGSAGQARIAVMALGNHAIVLRTMHRAREAADALYALLPRYREFGMRPNEGLAECEIGRCHEALGEQALARDHFRRAVALLRDGGVQDDLLQALEGLARCEEQRGEPAAALEAMKELRDVEKQRRDEAARQALVQRELRVELARLTSQWARQAVQDPLTGLANRRGLERWLAEHWPRAEQGQPLAVVLMDLDHFKRINDTHGHDLGDRVLQSTARLLRAECRSSDLAVRYGGEEFLIAMAGSDLGAAAAQAERVRALVHQHDWTRVAPGLQVSASLGVADASEALETGALLTLADRRLYAAKFGGRNRVVAAG